MTDDGWTGYRDGSFRGHHLVRCPRQGAIWFDQDEGDPVLCARAAARGRTRRLRAAVRRVPEAGPSEVGMLVIVLAALAVAGLVVVVLQHRRRVARDEKARRRLVVRLTHLTRR